MLMPVKLLKGGLVAAIEIFLDKARKGEVQISWQHHAIPEISEDKSLQIFRAVKEITYNTHKHSRAKNLSFVMAVYDGILILDSQDDGIGFHDPGTTDGMGLAILQKRVAVLNGSLNVSSQPGKGTHIVIEIPLS